MSQIDKDRPAIYIALPDGDTSLPPVLQPMLLGIEEEQIPYQLVDHAPEAASVIQRAYAAAVESKLSVGVAYDQQQVVVHYKNLAPDRPLFIEPITTPAAIRVIGANAARLVKGVPFKLQSQVK